ncbi:hypothetical protein AJ85_20895 [Alkalihalobacillus alcalophilus ATCC 27647 = CGMCC 1.3604]|uniref:Acetyltransferase n=1 Tax=Alkalihalobacillus alcalophilus ATCC 27647 = CGMCC 1.3604 TaxID=1218173 RepID=A0A094WGF8_ALKAL|nr:GNAT family N-acetyltransferase [Alkalihalobacillus alcalophilus]KGA96824.1 acetyltransferase [Alkalihalobacillus alcalophilus ATCC 27647 = CGMCC 1.3604]MED1561213.1 GNAT family N-acetyltransferase [Alkalihalobacillus alcalophilus]THG88858.1 hypothetical protein AJ85_20895 [Alkalihalobacillus alcalophilus ATCC 27647 = CGMCC 1.3604]
MNIEKVNSKKQLEDAYRVRKEVFVGEQNVPIEEEIDQYEDEATHFVVYNEEHEAIGAARLREVDGSGKIERVCIVQTARGTGIGYELMNVLLDEIKERKLTKAKLNAQIQAEPFYQKLGFETVSGQFLDAGIPHVTMIKTM